MCGSRHFIVLFFLDYPEQYEESLKKHEVLDKYLKNVFVKSYDPEVRIYDNVLFLNLFFNNYFLETIKKCR